MHRCLELQLGAWWFPSGSRGSAAPPHLGLPLMLWAVNAGSLSTIVSDRFGALHAMSVGRFELHKRANFHHGQRCHCLAEEKRSAEASWRSRVMKPHVQPHEQLSPMPSSMRNSSAPAQPSHGKSEVAWMSKCLSDDGGARGSLHLGPQP